MMLLGLLPLAGCAGTFVVSWDRPAVDATGAALPASVPVRYGVLLGTNRVVTTSNMTATVSTTKLGTNDVHVVADVETCTITDSDGTRSEYQSSVPASATVVERPQAGPPEKLKVRK
jgi:hypothetical protein